MFDKQKSAVLKSLALAFGLVFILSVSSCQPANPNANANANSVNSNSNVSNVNSNSASTDSGPIINTREPEKYSATLVFTLETEGGDKAMGIPPLSVQVARSGADRRVEFKLPDEYAELSQEATGFQLHKMLTPGQLVEALKNKRGVEPAGEGLIDGRAAEKYRYSASTNTNTKAGEVKAEAFVYVDKETGLPLRAEMLAESSGDVKGVKAARIVAEMKDIKTEIAPTLFEVPTGYAQVAPEKIRQQINALTDAVAAILKALISNSGAQSGASPSPSSAPSSPAPTKP
jgi:hypothetical protein